MNEQSKLKIWIDSTDRKTKSVFLKNEKDEVLAKKEGEIDIVSSVKDLLKENNLKVNDVLYQSNLGPGSFTGLKVGVTIANILNWATGQKSLEELDLPEYGREPNITPPKKFKL